MIEMDQKSSIIIQLIQLAGILRYLEQDNLIAVLTPTQPNKKLQSQTIIMIIIRLGCGAIQIGHPIQFTPTCSYFSIIKPHHQTAVLRL